MKISVIIPVYNNLPLTIRCIASLEKLSYHFKETEVIIVDDGSDDGTADYFTRFATDHAWLTYHRNLSNLKFARSCNAGAEIARGEFLVFLNNDTIVTKNWDKHLLETLQNDRDTWMAGAKLLYPNGTIQHAGVYLPELQKTSFSHVYRGFPSYFPPANTEKDLQCVTAACMIMRKADFLDLGGFDTSFLNGLEDVDLCLRITEKGKKIIYQPKSEVFHFESRSEGRYSNSKQNAELFYTRWHDRMKPDMSEMISKDILEGLDSGTLVKAGEISGLKIGTGKPLPLAIPPGTATSGNDLLVVIECNSPGPGEVKLSYKTRSGYDDRSLLDTVQPLTAGHNLILFTFLPAYADPKPVVVFKGTEPLVEITSLAIYKYSIGTPAIKPRVLVLHHAEYESGTITDLMQGLQAKDIPADFSSGNLTSEFTADNLNAAINNSSADYILILDKGVRVKTEFLLHSMEIMELNPAVGFVYSDMVNLGGEENTLIKHDFNPVTVLSAGKTDIAGLFRKKCWADQSGLDSSLSCFMIYDLFLAILASGNWKGYKLRNESFNRQTGEGISMFDYKGERDRIVSKYARYLLKESGKIISRERNARNNM